MDILIRYARKSFSVLPISICYDPSSEKSRDDSDNCLNEMVQRDGSDHRLNETVLMRDHNIRFQ